MLASARQTETEAVEEFVRTTSRGRTVASVLREVFFALQSKRASAYSRLDAALRASTRPDLPPAAADRKRAPAHESWLGGDDVADPYAWVCAHVTEELKVAAEGVAALEEVLRGRVDRQGRQRNGAGEEERHAREALRLLEQLRKLEERKMVTKASFHVLKRSRALGVDSKGRKVPAGFGNGEQSEGIESMTKKIQRYAKELNGIDEEINELLNDVRQLILDAGEEAYDRTSPGD